MAVQHIQVQGHQLEYVRISPAHPRPDAPTLLMLHEGLGCVAMWRTFPQLLAEHTGCRVIVFSRYGYGGSTPRDGTPRTPDYMHHEAFRVLPELLEKLNVGPNILFGHSDGGSIALLHASQKPHSGQETLGIIVLAPHILVEAITLSGIRAALNLYQTTDLQQRLARYHPHVDRVFYAWTDIWLHPDFRNWNIEEALEQLNCPVLAIQGEQDEYGSMAQITGIAARHPQTTLLPLPNCGHSPHRDQPDAVLAAACAFIEAQIQVRQTIKEE